MTHYTYRDGDIFRERRIGNSVVLVNLTRPWKFWIVGWWRKVFG